MVEEQKINKPTATNVLNWICSEKWAITEEWLRTIISIAARENFEAKYDALLARGGEPLKNTRKTLVRGSTAIVPLIGPIFPRANLFTQISGATSLEELSSDFVAALDAPDIDNIILKIDSPGGQTTMTGEFADLVFASRDKKNIVAFVEGGAHSAAFWIATQTSQIILGPAAIVGSIGTMVTFIDDTKQLAEQGLKEIEIVSSLSPNKNRDPSTKAGRDDVIQILDDITQVFIDAVARGRGVTAEKVLSEFGQGKSFVGQTAIDLGMADSTGTLESLIEQLTTNNNSLTGGITMSLDIAKLTAEELKVANPALYLEISSKSEAKGLEVGKIEGHAEGVKAENERIKSIEGFENSETKDIIAKHKFDSTKSADSIAGIVLASQKATTEEKAAAILEDGEDLGEKSKAIDGSASGDDKAAADDAAVDNMVAGANGSHSRRNHRQQGNDNSQYRTLASHSNR